MKKQYQIPFDEKGNLLHYPDRQTKEWKDNYIFHATLIFKSFARGRSAAYALFEDVEGRKYPMFLTFLDAILMTRDISGGKVEGDWTFHKRGQNYSIGLDK